MRQSTADGQNDRNCGASAKAISRSAGWNVQPGAVRQRATRNGSAMIRNGASAAGAALYQRTRVSVTEPSSQLRPTRRGMMVSEVGRAPVSRPTQ